MQEDISQPGQISHYIERLNCGEESAREELLNVACERLVRMTRKMKRDFPAVARWEQTDDVFQNASIRLYWALADVNVVDSLHFFRLAAVQIRRELIDLARHYQGQQGMGKNHQTQGLSPSNVSRPGTPAYEPEENTHQPGLLAEWAEMHEKINQLSDSDREVFDLLWYHELPQEEAAEMLQISVRQLKRRWRAAKMNLMECLGGECPAL